MLKSLIEGLPPQEAAIRIYRNAVCLNAPAARLLGFGEEGGYLAAVSDTDASCNGRVPVYVGVTGSSHSGLKVTRRGKCVRVNSRALAGRLAEALDGYGTYRICPEDRREAGGTVYFNIFYRRYGS